MEEILKKININDIVNDLQRDVINKKNILSKFLQCHKFKNNMSINEYVIDFLMKTEHDVEHPNYHEIYTYYIGGGYSWNELDHFLIDTNNNEPVNKRTFNIVTIVGILEIVYMFNDLKILKDKIKSIYTGLFLPLQRLLNQNKLATNIQFYNINTDLTFPKKPLFSLFKPLQFKISLVIDNQVMDIDGGFKKKRQTKVKTQKNTNLPIKKIITYKKRKSLKQKGGGKYALLSMILNSIIQDTTCQNIDIDRLKSDYNNYSILEFEFQYYNTRDSSSYEKEVQENFIKDFKKEVQENFIKKFHHNFIVENVTPNRLKYEGVLMMSYLNTYNKKNEMGLNINYYRQKLFLDKYNGNTPFIKKTFEDILGFYKAHFFNRLYDKYFVDKIENIINKYSSYHYEAYIDFFSRLFVSYFRPAVNAFIVEINKELFAEFKIILFIAGGDAMRRYDPDISFTKDIDTKLYIKSVIEDQTIQDKLYDSLPVKVIRASESLATHKLDIDSDVIVMENQRKGVVKKKIIDIIVKHIVKLRNFLETNLSKVLKNHTFFKYASDEEYDYYLCFSVVPYIKEDNQRFRTREIRKSKEFPVDLYSIDFKTYLIKLKKGVHINTILKENDEIKKIDEEIKKIEEEIKTNKIKLKTEKNIEPVIQIIQELSKNLRQKKIIKNIKIDEIKTSIKEIDISVLDVVLEDDGVYDSKQHTKYELTENELTEVPVASPYFIINDFNTTYSDDDRILARMASNKYLKDIQRYEKMYKVYTKHIDRLNPQEFTVDLNNIITPFKDDIIDTNFETNVLYIFEKYKNSTQFVLEDILKIIDIVKDANNFTKLIPSIQTQFTKIANLQTNILFEELDKIDIEYSKYNLDENDEYHKLFNYLVSLKDGQQKHKISFSNKMIKSEITKMKNDIAESVKIPRITSPSVGRLSGISKHLTGISAERAIDKRNVAKSATATRPASAHHNSRQIPDVIPIARPATASSAPLKRKDTESTKPYPLNRQKRVKNLLQTIPESKSMIPRGGSKRVS